MSYTEFIYAIGDAITASFELLKAGGNTVNYLLIAIGLVLMINWMRQMTTHDEQYEENRP